MDRSHCVCCMLHAKKQRVQSDWMASMQFPKVEMHQGFISPSKWHTTCILWFVSIPWSQQDYQVFLYSLCNSEDVQETTNGQPTVSRGITSQMPVLMSCAFQHAVNLSSSGRKAADVEVMGLNTVTWYPLVAMFLLILGILLAKAAKLTVLFPTTSSQLTSSWVLITRTDQSPLQRSGSLQWLASPW